MDKVTKIELTIEKENGTKLIKYLEGEEATKLGESFDWLKWQEKKPFQSEDFIRQLEQNIRSFDRHEEEIQKIAEPGEERG